MLNYIKNELAKFNIDLVSTLNLDECEIKRPYLLEKNGINSGSVIIFAVPYLNEISLASKNISSYAVSRDYHLFFATLFDNVISNLKTRFPDNKFIGFTDHSPINEIKAAAQSGLGIIGTNHLLITEKYSSYIFLGEIITDAILPSNASKIKYCINCQKCVLSCPVSTSIEKCLSALTQKKGELDESEKELIKKHGCAWGCDICQQVCPYTKQAIKNNSIFTKIDFFNHDLTPFITYEEIEGMSDEKFKERAYSWRGKQVIQRNLKILEGKES